MKQLNVKEWIFWGARQYNIIYIIPSFNISDHYLTS